MSYRIEPTTQAFADVERIYDWLSQRSADGATRWYEPFRDATERLKHFPASCALAARASYLARHVEGEVSPWSILQIRARLRPPAYPIRPGRAAIRRGLVLTLPYGSYPRSSSRRSGQ